MLRNTNNDHESMRGSGKQWSLQQCCVTLLPLDSEIYILFQIYLTSTWQVYVHSTKGEVQAYIPDMQFYFFINPAFVHCSSSGCGFVSHFLTPMLLYLLLFPASHPPLCYCSCSHDPYSKPYQGTDLGENKTLLYFFWIIFQSDQLMSSFTTVLQKSLC